MFVLEPSMVQFTASPDDVLTLLTSLNKPMVALEDHPMDEGEATIWSVRRESEMVSTYVHLCLTSNKTGVFYRYEVDPYPDDLRGMVEAEALGFAESLGFIMDNTHYAELDAEERKQHLVRGPFDWPGLEIAAEGPDPAPGAAETSGGGTADFGEAEEDVISSRGSDEAPAFLSDEEVDGAVRALTGAEPSGPGGDPTDAEFDRAVEEFIAGGEDAGDDAPRAEEPVARPEPVDEAGAAETAEPAAPAAFARSPLSRFQRRKAGSDIYEIRGLAQAPEARERVIEEAPAPEASVQEPRAPSADIAPADPETRRRRARARFLASF